MEDKPPTKDDFEKCCDVLEYMSANYEIHFKTHGDEMKKDEAKKHFDDRCALIRSQILVVNEIEKIENKK